MPTPTLYSAARARCCLLAMVLGVAMTASAQMAPNAMVALPGSTLTIRGSTTIGKSWHCTATDIIASASVIGGDRASQAGAVTSVTVSVPVSALRCQSAPMTRAMVKAMRAENDSTSAIMGNFSGRPAADGHGAGETHLDGTLTVAGVVDTVALTLSVAPVAESVFHIQSLVALKLSSFRITPPRVLFGAIRARDAITVEVDLHFARSGEKHPMAAPIVRPGG